MKKLLAVILAASLGLSGCAALLPQGSQEKIASGVRKYCVGASPAERLLIRQNVNAMLTGVAEVKVTCVGDPQ